jgi:hypothetical protein
VKIDYRGAVYDFDVTDLDIGECEQIEKFCQVKGMGDWANQLGSANTRAIQALWWVVRRHAGEDAGVISRRDPEFRPLAFSLAYSAAEKAEADEADDPGEADEEDPTTRAAG